MGLLTDLLGDGNATSSALWIPANQFMADGGSPVLTQSTTGGFQHGWPAFAFDAAAAESAVSTTMTPTGWSTVDLVLWWTNLGTNSGDVVWRAAHDSDADGGAMATGGTVESSVTATAPARRVMEVTTLVSGVSVTADQPLLVGIQRIGSDGADTLGNDAGFVGVQLVKAS